MLNQEKTGKFIAEMRRQQNLTQRQLAERVGVSDKTVSKWETGRSMPDNSILLDVCLILNVSVNELLSGEKLAEEYYVDKAEVNMVELVEECEYHRKKGNNCPYCGNQKLLRGYNDLATTNPKLAKEWNYAKNTFGPETVMEHTNKKVWWKCEKGHEWL